MYRCLHSLFTFYLSLEHRFYSTIRHVSNSNSTPHKPYITISQTNSIPKYPRQQAIHLSLPFFNCRQFSWIKKKALLWPDLIFEMQTDGWVLKSTLLSLTLRSMCGVWDVCCTNCALQVWIIMYSYCSEMCKIVDIRYLIFNRGGVINVWRSIFVSETLG